MKSINTPIEKISKKLYFFENKVFLQLVSGGIAGAVSRSTVAPIQRIIILKQTNNEKYTNKSMSEMIIKMYRTEGITSLFKGNWANCLRIAPFQAIEFFVFDQLKFVISSSRSFESHNSLLSFLSPTSLIFIAGALSGATASISVYPLDLVKTHLAVNTDKEVNGVFRTMFRLAKDRGLFSLYRGLKPTLIGSTPYASLKLSFFELIQQYVYGEQPSHIPVQANLLFGAVAGCLAVSVTYPTDLIRRRMQLQMIDKSLGQTVGIFSTALAIVKNQGVFQIYAGLFATYCKILPSTALAFAINQFLKEKIKV